MTPRLSSPAILSDFTISLLLDTGFYEVDREQAQEFYYGKDNGCEFLVYDSCDDDFEEICDESSDENLCTWDYLNKTKCEDRNFVNGCRIHEPNKSLSCKSYFPEGADYEFYGKNSRCFEIQDKDSACFESFCWDGGVFVVVDG